MKRPFSTVAAAGFLFFWVLSAAFQTDLSATPPACSSESAKAGSRAPAPDEQALIKTENGIPVVHNPKEPAPPAGAPRTLTLKPDLTIGAESGDENYVFASIRYLLIDEDENIYALDDKEVRIKVFDKTGKFLRAFGKKGQGPGEIGGPNRLESAPQKMIVLSDFANRKFIFFSPDGVVRKELSMGKSSINRFKIDSRGFFYAVGIAGLPGEDSGYVLEVRKFDPQLQPQALLASVQRKELQQVLPAFSPMPAVVVTSKDEAVWTIADSDKYEFTVTAPDGKVLRKIVKDYDPTGITAPRKAALIKDAWGDRGLPPGYTFDVPTHYPAFFNFIIDDKDRLFVRTYAFETKGNEVWISHDVFDAEGRSIARFSLPEGEMVFAVRKDKLYSRIAENAEGIPQIKRYSLIWK